MKRFYFNIILFLSIFLVVVFTFKANQKFYWGNKQMSTKMLHFYDSEEKYNTFFFGSSRVYRQIVPSIFDKTINSKTSSFNFGAPATFIPETYFLYEKFTDENQIKNSTIFIEVQPLLEIADINVGTKETIYYMNFNSLKFALNHIIADQKTNKIEKVEKSKNFILSFLANTICYTTFKGVFNSIFNFIEIDDRYLGQDNDGYLSKEQQLLDNLNPHIVRRARNRFLRKNKNRKDEKFIPRKVKMYEKAASNENYNEHHLKYLEYLIEDANSKNNELIFIMMPQTFQNTMGLFNKLPNENKIDVINPAKYSQLYQKKMSFDIGHFNEEGAAELTKLLAVEYIKWKEKYN